LDQAQQVAFAIPTRPDQTHSLHSVIGYRCGVAIGRGECQSGKTSAQKSAAIHVLLSFEEVEEVEEVEVQQALFNYFNSFTFFNCVSPILCKSAVQTLQSTTELRVAIP
jgi:hypothetical protein